MRGEGSLPASLAAAIGARRIIEVGTALGYTALSMADAVPTARVESVEMDGDHAHAARAHIARHHMAERIDVHHGTAEKVLATLVTGAYDMAFFDGFTPTADIVQELRRLLRPGGTLLAGNLILGPDRTVVDSLGDPSR
ncbi:MULTISPECIES: class I SAM-dependent methyltransferase [unclassified Streptomyces]|uniref:O-methyltransferase n=1 Tax=unclassified Streptomyces TaxID=2593676 RepID=UPI00344E4BC1